MLSPPGVGIFAIILVAVFLDNIDRAKAQQFRDKREPFCSTFFATFKHLRDRRQLLLIPLTMYSGFEQSFLAGEYTRVREARIAEPLPSQKRSPTLFSFILPLPSFDRSVIEEKQGQIQAQANQATAFDLKVMEICIFIYINYAMLC